jgi:hypothetical protein
MSNTFHLSGDNWELSGWPKSSLQAIDIACLIVHSLVQARAG